jgi:hypothetical protein
MAEGKGIRKSVKRDVALATSKPKAKPPLATTHDTTTELSRVEGGQLEEQFSKTVIREAQRLDEKIVRTIDRMGKDFVVLGEMFSEMQSTGYHRAIINPVTGRGYGMFPEYLKARYPDRSPTQIFQAMRIVRELTSGPNPSVSKDDVREMSRDNAEGLARMKKQGMEITPELIEQAKTLQVHRFKDEVLLPSVLDIGARSAPQGTAELQAEVQVKRVFYLAGTTNSNLDKAIEIIQFLGEGHERDRGQSLDDYIISALVGDFLAAYAKDYEEMIRVRNAEAVHAITMTQDALGPEPPSEGSEDDEDESEDDDDDKDEDDGENDEEEAHVKTSGGESSAIPICHHTKDDGVRCGAPSVKNSRYCYFHKKHYVENRPSAQASASLQ